MRRSKTAFPLRPAESALLNTPATDLCPQTARREASVHREEGVRLRWEEVRRLHPVDPGTQRPRKPLPAADGKRGAPVTCFQLSGGPLPSCCFSSPPPTPNTDICASARTANEAL